MYQRGQEDALDWGLQAKHLRHDAHHMGGHVGKSGTKEDDLTGNSAEMATVAALAAVPGGTVERVETHAEGAVYEAHMTKSDGSHVTVKFYSSFNVTSTEDGPNGPHGQN